MKIAMWSGPRNLSTAMMYSFAARSDCTVVDEPYYAAYLAKTGLDHPMRNEIVASQSSDADVVKQEISVSIKGTRPHFYQKHMTHHMLSEFDLGWMANVINVFLIRHPARVIASYVRKRQGPTLDDLGIVQQEALYHQVQNFGQTPIVIDSFDIRRNPRAALTKLCEKIDLPFQENMLSWSKGGIPQDGVWADHWYEAVHDSAGFAGSEGPLPEISDDFTDLLATALPYYLKMEQQKLRI
ncbi:MAG: sulfotransferase-like domain-containing protein [Paracoccaceae bacterium]